MTNAKWKVVRGAMPVPAWPDGLAAHRAFHQALLTGCQSPRLEGIANSLRDGAELYRRWYWSLTEDHTRDLAAEHHRLKELALSRDAGAAVAALTEHIERAPRSLIAYAQERGLETPVQDTMVP